MSIKLEKVGEELKNIKKKELTPLQIEQLKVSVLEGEIKVWKHKCEQLESQLIAKNVAFGDLLKDEDFEEIL